MEDLEEPLFLATASGENVKLWNLPNLEDLGLHSVRPYSGAVNCACWSWSINNSLLATAFDEQINVTGIKGESTVDLFTEAEQLCLSFSSNSRYLLSGSKLGAVCIWDLKHRTKRKSFSDRKSSVLCATFNFSDTVIASGDQNGDVLLHAVVTGAVTGPLRTQQTQAIRSIQYSNFKKSLLGTASDDGNVNLWDINTKQIIKEFKEHRLPATGFRFSPANDMLSCSIGIDKKIMFYDVIGKKSIKTINTDSPLTSVDFLYNGSCIAVGSSTGKLYLFDLRAGSSPLKTAIADKSAIKTVSFQKPMQKSSSKGLTRKSSDSSIASNSSNKSREGKNDASAIFTETPKPKEPLKSKKVPSKQSVSLFSPLRGGDFEAEAGTSDVDIVPMETMRAEISKRATSSKSSAVEDSRTAITQSSSKVSNTMQLRFVERSKDLESEISDNELENLKSRLSKAIKDDKMDQNATNVKNFNGKLPDQNGLSMNIQDDATANMQMENGLHPFQVDFIRNMIEDAMEDSRDAMHRGFIHLQGEMIRQFHIHQEETRRLVEQMSLNTQLVEENERLRDEIKRLKTNY